MPAKYVQRINRDDVYFHIFNSGNEGRILFNDEADYDTFLAFVKEYLSLPTSSDYIRKSFTVKGRTYQGVPHQPKNYHNKVELIAYYISPTQYHLLLHQITSGSLENFIRSLCTRYSMYYNKKYQRTGSLFEGPYKSVHIDSIETLANLTCQLHHSSFQSNKDAINRHSSYAEYLRIRNTLWIKPNIVLTFFNASKNSNIYQNLVENYESDKKEEKPLEQTASPKLASSQTIPQSRIASISSEISQPDLDPLSYSNFFKYTMAMAVFLILFSFGISNVWVTSKDKNIFTPSLSPEVAGTKDEAPYVSEVESSFQETNSVSTEEDPMTSPVPDSINEVTLAVKKDYESVDIYVHEIPRADSKVVSIAKYGDTFEYISHFSGWYKVRLSDNSFGYVLETLLEIVKRENI